jgi:hypothetical protein
MTRPPLRTPKSASSLGGHGEDRHLSGAVGQHHARSGGISLNLIGVELPVTV